MKVLRIPVCAGLLLLTAAPALAADVPAPETVCTVKDSRLNELSGLVSDGKQWYAINDGGTKIQVFVLGRDCAVKKVISNPTDPFDVEDLARASDGTLWLSDTGDNKKARETVALHAVTPAGKSTLYRLSYPDGQHDTEALLLDKKGVPYLITKDVLGEAKIYRPSGELQSPGPTPLEKVGSLKIQATDTPGSPVGSFGSVLVTGAASTVDGTVIAVRTYTDAYLYSAPDGDVVAALKRQPVRVPLPNEKQGEAIAFEPDGTLLSGSEGVGEPIRAVAGAAGLVTPPSASSSAGESSSSASGSPESSGVPMVPAIAIALAVAAGGVFGVSKLRRRRR
ncbi:hypothetical protein AB5J62_28385 [Amycolatopsis sp. cg5]|uniref:hypothetical protein n=1 Tax=Amycolatopsis sp. cg5 TaxID=3238802 RepID=UPI0035256F83